jgi:BirA family biotin operon repressor/biotin-[acetyl-CoA-carboxylase] ligase
VIADLATLVSPWGAPVVALESVDSTNEEVRRRAAAGAPEGLVVVADSQTAGRGRRGHTWHSPPGAGVYLSLLLRPKVPAAEAVALPLRAGLATCRALRALGLEPVLKWPNDVLVGGRKVAGILVESVTGREGLVDVAVVGIGVNVAAHPMPADIAHTATSIESALGRPVPRADLAARLLRALGSLSGGPSS